jgi:hypothetical protein
MPCSLAISRAVGISRIRVGDWITKGRSSFVTVEPAKSLALHAGATFKVLRRGDAQRLCNIRFLTR